MNSPISIVADAVARAVKRRWASLPDLSAEKLHTLDPSALATAAAWLDQERKNLVEQQFRDHAASVAAEHEQYRKSFERSEDRTEGGWVRDLLITVSVSLLTAIVLFALTAALTAVAYFVVRQPVTFLLLGGIVVLLACALRLVDTATSPKWRFQEAYVYGTGYFVRLPLSPEPLELAAQRDLVTGALESEPETSVPADPDLGRASDGDAIALPPGVTEVALASSEDTIAEIRAYLVAVRRQHLFVSSISFLTFIGVIGATVYSALFRGLEVGPQLLGGGGVGAVIGAFCYASLNHLRTSQIALALFSSYLAELRQSLHAAEKLTEPERRRAARTGAWQDFRRGINELWHLENRMHRRPGSDA